MRGDGTGRSLREAVTSGWRELAMYLGAGALYVAIGVYFPDFLFSWVVAAGYLVLCLVILPAVARRLFS